MALLFFIFMLPAPPSEAQEANEDLDEIAQFDLDELEGDERVRAIESLLKQLDDDNAAVLCTVLRSEKDEERVKEKVFQALMVRGGPALYEPALEMLQTPDQAVASFGASLLGRSRDKKALRPLLEACRSPSPGVPTAALKALGDLGEPGCLQSLLEFRQKDPELAGEATLSLVRIRHSPALPWIFEIYEKISQEIEEWSRMEEWARHHIPAQRFANEQARAAAKKNLIRRVGHAFTQLSPEMTTQFVDIATTWEGKFLPSFLAEQLPHLVRKENASHFLKLLDYDSPPLALTLIETLDALGDPALKGAVDEKIRGFWIDPNIQRRIVALQICWRFAPEQRHAMILEGLEDRSRWVRLEAAKTLVLIPVRSAASLLQSRLEKETDCQLRYAYRVALHRMAIETGK